MKLRVLLVAFVTLLAGCAPGQMMVAPEPLKGSQTCSGPCSNTVTPSCSLFSCGGKLDFDPTYITGRGVLITYNVPEGYAFCRQRGDGVFLKSETSDEFEPASENWQGQNCKTWFKMVAHNRTQRPDPYLYKVVFTRLSDGKTHTIDPSFYNR